MFISDDINTLMYQGQCINVFDSNDTETYDKKMTILRKNLEKEMASREWNAYVLSDRSGVPQPTIQRFLKGKIGDPRANTVRKLASGLGITESALRGFDNRTSERVQIISDLMASLSNEELNGLELIIRSMVSANPENKPENNQNKPLTETKDIARGGGSKPAPPEA